ncbi:MAG: anthranilate synthase component I [Myxococcota bacterium]|nr:anthranilate synthase component I [Myxococcota bacterium]
MLRPSLEQFEELATQGNLIPVVREILADLDTPLSLFRRLDDGETSFLLESVQGGEKWARYSFVGTGARARFRAQGRQVEWIEGDAREQVEVEGDPLAFLRDKLAELHPVKPEGFDLPRFVGGAVGMVGYEWVRFVENIPDTNPDTVGLPDLSFTLPEVVVVYDNVRHTALIVKHVRLRDGDDPAECYARAGREIDGVIDQLRAPIEPEPRREASRQPMEVERNLTREAYHEIVKRGKEYVEAGDVFQVVLAQQFTLPLQVDPFTIYRQLRAINPSPYLFYVRIEGAIVIGSSPEILVRLEGDRIDVRPRAGTRRRGRDPEDEARMEHELRTDPKEIAEHVMLVDLGRNDVGRVAQIGSVEVNEYANVEKYSHVMHTVSNVQAKLDLGYDWLDVLRATFPAGTLSGAPKVRAMEIIDELETVRRGIYGGCVGYIDYSGNMDMAITIRTMVVKDEKITLLAGAGVVADSDPELEFKETLNKSRALVHAIDLAREGTD